VVGGGGLDERVKQLARFSSSQSCGNFAALWLVGTTNGSKDMSTAVSLVLSHWLIESRFMRSRMRPLTRLTFVISEESDARCCRVRWCCTRRKRRHGGGPIATAN